MTDVDAAKDDARRKATAFKRAMRPEIAAGGFARDDSRIGFVLRVDALLRPDMTVLDLGAGRGAAFRGPDTYVKRLIKLQGKVRKVIGIDVDPAIAEHPYLDERHVVEIGAPFPIDSGSVDLVVSDWVLEHIAAPAAFAAEIGRILKPGGWFCARTPNRWGYVGLGANLLPNALHGPVLSRVSPGRHEEDVFPTVYRLNSRGAVRRFFPAPRWEDYSYFVNSTPQYHGNNRLMFGLIGLYQSIMPPALRTDFIVMLRKAP